MTEVLAAKPIEKQIKGKLAEMAKLFSQKQFKTLSEMCRNKVINCQNMISDVNTDKKSSLLNFHY
jgi:hypothetical protein